MASKTFGLAAEQLKQMTMKDLETLYDGLYFARAGALGVLARPNCQIWEDEEALAPEWTKGASEIERLVEAFDHMITDIVETSRDADIDQSDADEIRARARLILRYEVEMMTDDAQLQHVGKIVDDAKTGTVAAKAIAVRGSDTLQ